jgi:hypothetical protein
VRSKEMDPDVYAASLRIEREGYARYKRTDRVAMVDAELARIGAEEATSEPVKRGPGRPPKPRAGERE